MCKGVLQHTSIRFTSINTIKLWGYNINYIILIYPYILIILSLIVEQTLFIVR